MASYLMGIDLGTSAVKVGVFRADGVCAGMGRAEYPLETPEPGAAVQSQERWWKAVCDAVRESLRDPGIRGNDVAGIGFSGQTHGAVLLDVNHQPLGDAFTWADRRSAGLVDEIDDLMGEELREKNVMNRVFPGTQLTILHWLRNERPKVWESIRRVLLPKDYIRFRMCGLYTTEPSDASGTLLFDIDRREWSDTLLDRFHIPPTWLPYVVNSDEHIAETEGVEEACGLPDGIPLTVGGADQPCAALGNGIVDPGTMLATIGSGGQLFAPLAAAKPSPDLALHTFCHVPHNRWYRMGATLSAGLSLKWFRDTLCPDCSFAVLSQEAAQVNPGADGLVFDPRLAGSRLPDRGDDVSASFRGLRLHHTRGHLARAVMEGVVFELRELYDLMGKEGITARTLACSGGMAESPVWRSILADVFELPVSRNGVGEHACFGAALLGGIGCGVYSGFADAVSVVPPGRETTEPDPSRSAAYREVYRSHADTGKI